VRPAISRGTDVLREPGDVAERRDLGIRSPNFGGATNPLQRRMLLLRPI
jgi:hypothetical protein